MKPKILLIFSLFILSACGTAPTGIQPVSTSDSAATPPTPHSPFLVFDALLYQGKPATAQLGMSAIRVIYEGELFTQNESRDQPDIARIQNVAATLQANGVVCVDIECWPLTGSPDIVNGSIQKYITVATTIKSVAPTVKLGFYAALPNRNYNPNDPSSPRYLQWQSENDALQPIAAVVDYVFPSLYTLVADPQSWTVFAKANISEARRYNKPVYPFLWPEYHDSLTTLAGTYIPQNYWQLELATCRTYADGIVVWGGYRETWDASAPWLLSLQSFMTAIQPQN